MQANLFEALIAQGASPRVLIVSTGAVYAAGGERLTEESPTAPDSPYAVSKLTQEVLAQYYRRRGFDVLIARPFNHFGPGQQRGFIVADMASQIAELERLGGGTIRVGNLQAERDYTDVRDVVRAYLSIARHGKTGQLYNVCSGRSRSAQSIVKRLAALASVSVDVISDPELFRPVDQMTVNAVNTKVCEQTGWLPTIDFDQTLADTLDYWRDLERGDLS
jgi:GDP-4-dehydro-6-deoxy-D-mannose reductase